MKTLVFMALAYSVCAATAAQGQGLTKPWNEPTPLTPQDRAIIASTVQTQIHGKPPNTAAAWNNPASGHSGTVTLLSKTARQGRPCEKIGYQIVEPGGGALHGRYEFTSCQVPDGSWKIAE